MTNKSRSRLNDPNAFAEQLVAKALAPLVGLLIVACDKPTPTKTDAAVSTSTLTPDASAPVDPAAVRAACEELARIEDAATDKYFALSTPHDVSREALSCIAQASLPGSGYTADAIRDCARIEGEAACRSIVSWGAMTKFCDVRGRLETGAACSFGVQCASGACVVPRGAECGVCGAALPKEDEACAVDQCGLGLTCVDHRCIRGAPLGGACTGEKPCDAEGTCVGGRCQALAKKRERCDPDAIITRSGKAPACVPPLECGDQNKCVEQKHRAGRQKKLAETCAADGDTCREGYCKRRDDEVGLCVPYNVDGTACDPDEDQCAPPAYCSRTNRHCEIRGAHRCE